METSVVKWDDLRVFLEVARQGSVHSAAKRLNLPEEKVFINIQNYGNTSAASIPLALTTAVRQGRLSRGSLVLLASVGAGFTVGVSIACGSLLLRALRIPVEKLKAKEIDSVKERVTCLRWELGRTPGTTEIKAALARGFERGLGIRLVPAGLTPEDIGFIVVGTTTPDHFFPSTACLVQRKIGAPRAWGFDLSAGCSAFTFSQNWRNSSTPN